MPHGEHHIHQRKRIHIYNQPFPHPDKKIRFIDSLAMINSIVMPLTTLPQIFRIYHYKIVDGLSIAMWILYCISCLIMLPYAIVHKSKELIVLNVMWLIVNLIIIFGIILYS
ncbi:hypothetical protein K9L16_00930 [Candidatus Pacearchaeota archaeon]|nr:hypothetical protein [Candidatus Pacearchaeota archaeon]